MIKPTKPVVCRRPMSAVSAKAFGRNDLRMTKINMKRKIAPQKARIAANVNG